LTGDYSTDVAAACLALRDAGARTELTDAELASFPLLKPKDKTPCLRVGPLSPAYYVGLARRAVDAITGKEAAFGQSDCKKRRDPKEVARCNKVFEDRWSSLEKRAQTEH
jgi:hypothetical protein